MQFLFCCFSNKPALLMSADCTRSRSGSEWYLICNCELLFKCTTDTGQKNSDASNFPFISNKATICLRLSCSHFMSNYIFFVSTKAELNVVLLFNFNIIFQVTNFENTQAKHKTECICSLFVFGSNHFAHGIGDTALIHFKISMRLLIFIEVRPIIYQKLQNFANINNLMLK